MNGVRGDFGQRGENEISFGEARMRNGQDLGPDDGILAEQNINIDNPGTISDGWPALHAFFDILDGVQDFQGCPLRFHLDNLIEKPGLIGKVHRLAPVKRRCRQNLETQFFQPSSRPSEISLRITEVASKTQIVFHPKVKAE